MSCILLRALVSGYTDCKDMRSMKNIGVQGEVA